MPLVFLFYLLCAVTDCPPPVLRNSSPSSDPVSQIFTAVASYRSHVLQSENRFTRSHKKYFKDSEAPTALTRLGVIQGSYMKSRKGRTIAAFEGIPYALPPINGLRFRNPVPVTSIPKKILVANHTQKDCLQLDFTRMLQVRGAEDCLYLNVYCPDIFHESRRLKRRGRPLLPVLVFLHGGGWMSHSSTPYGPRFLLDRDVVYVSFNFRLGVLGFLSTGDHNAPGNFGLKDQAMALKWIKNNIKDFGGDPNKITLIGESTGAGAAALHIIRKESVPIYGAILLSGTSMNHWAVMNNDTFSNTKALAQRMQCPTKRSSDLVECLRSRNPYMVVGQQRHLWTVPMISRLLFGPVIESPSRNNDAFLLEHPKVTYRFGKSSINHVPVIAGMNRNEGGLFAANAYLVPFMFNAINSNWTKMYSYIMAYDRVPGINMQETSKQISKFYFNKERWSYENIDKISEALGDRTISTGVYKFLESHSQVAPVYGYFFTYQSNFSLLRQMGLRGKEWGVSHGDELPFIFSMDQYYEDFKTQRDILVSEFLINLIINFSRDRQPTPHNIVAENVTWSPILTPKYMQVLEINQNKRMISFPYMDRMKFWERLDLM